MLNLLKKETNRTFTENGALTLKTTQSDCLDLFATIGALRHQSESEITERFMRAFAEDNDIAMKLLFYARDIRGGLGERRVFRVILKHMAQIAPNIIRKNLEYISEYGRFDDLLVLFNTPVEKDMLYLIAVQLKKDIEAAERNEEVSLLAKWLPSVNTSNAEAVKNAKRIARTLGYDDKTYRKELSKLRAYIRIIENNLRQKDYTFDYEKQPSKAMFKYRSAFLRNDRPRYTEYLNQVQRGEAKLNTSTLMPYEIIEPLLKFYVSEDEINAVNASWLSQEDFTTNENALAVIDGSGSMYSYFRPSPASVALSLGIYFAERNKGAFKNHFITFSENPQLVEIKGKDIAQKVTYCRQFDEVANTNIQKVFELILNTAIKNNLPPEEMPERLYIISDMEFDYCTIGAKLTNFEYAKMLFNEAGYALPDIVFWNVASRNQHQPVTMNEQGVTLVSGCTPKIFSAVSKGNMADLTPFKLMMDVLGSERYAKIEA